MLPFFKVLPIIIVIFIIIPSLFKGQNQAGVEKFNTSPSVVI